MKTICMKCHKFFENGLTKPTLTPRKVDCECGDCYKPVEIVRGHGKDEVIIRLGYSCAECGKNIHKSEWERSAKMCDKCYEKDGEVYQPD